jgi:cobalt-zinc-cadmium efflux system outer membrane protein
MRSLSSIAPLAFLGLLISHSSLAETALARAFADAWQRQPAVAALFERERAAAAKIDASSAWTATPPSLELSLRSDRFNQRNGAQENEIGLVLPLWLPGERSGSQALAEAEGAALAGRGQALRLRLAQVLRETWWRWQSAQNEAVLAGERVSAARQLRDDVTRRFNAGDLSRADLNQAEGALAQAMAQQAEAAATLLGATYRLESLTGHSGETGSVQPEPIPSEAASRHPAVQELQARLEVARRNVDLARTQTRANPEIAVSTRRDHAASSEPVDQTWALALRIPFSSGPRQDARVATANAEAIELGIELEREQERLTREAVALQLQLAAARQQLVAAEQRSRLARETRGFYEKSFHLGESDLPTRLRIESETFEAERALSRSRIALAQAVSQLRQSLGLLPE